MVQTVAAQMASARALLSGARAPCSGAAAAARPAADGVHWHLHALAAEDVAVAPVQAIVQRAIQEVIIRASVRPQAQLLRFLLGALRQRVAGACAACNACVATMGCCAGAARAHSDLSVGVYLSSVQALAAASGA